MKGHARARCGVSCVNALATGKGASIAVDLFVDATVILRDERKDIRVTTTPEADPRLAANVARRVLDAAGLGDVGADVETRADVPPSRGLKTSSAVANAVAHAASAASGRYGGTALKSPRLVDVGIDAAVAQGVTVTGAFDDATASVRGGLCVTDNRERRLLARHEMPDVVAVVAVPATHRTKLEAGKLDYTHVAPAVALAHERALKGDWAAAMTVNGLAYGSVYGADWSLHRAAVAAGAFAVSVTGTGPALAAITTRGNADAVADALAPHGDVLVAAVSNAPLEVSP